MIFDEASQIKPESSIVAIYRAKQVIVVGDKEQLPPTNFFENIDKDTNDHDYDAYKSILDISDTVLDSISLKWHYRSKFEELIKVSNHQIYKNLITFSFKHKASILPRC